MMDDKEIKELKEKFKEQGLDLETELAKTLQEEIAKELAKESYTWDEWCALPSNQKDNTTEDKEMSARNAQNEENNDS